MEFSSWRFPRMVIICSHFLYLYLFFFFVFLFFYKTFVACVQPTEPISTFSISHISFTLDIMNKSDTIQSTNIKFASKPVALQQTVWISYLNIILFNLEIPMVSEGNTAKIDCSAWRRKQLEILTFWVGNDSQEKCGDPKNVYFGTKNPLPPLRFCF